MRLFMEIPAELTYNGKKALVNPSTINMVAVDGCTLEMLVNGKKATLLAINNEAAEKIYQMFGSLWFAEGGVSP